ncbi:MAG: LamG-like jellyroll fold domain-containing protein [Pseudomonadota bacterium]
MTTYAIPVGDIVVDTPEGMTAAVTPAAAAGVPAIGAGLSGAAYAPGDHIRSLADVAAIVAANDPDATFTTTEIAYGARNSDTSIAEFLGDDAASIVGDGSLEMGPSALVLTGFIYIPPGTHTVSVVSDDGFSLSLGGVEFSEFDGKRASDATSRAASFDGGLYPIEIEYFDSHGGMSLALLIDGLVVDQSAFYPTVDAFENPPEGAPLVPVEDYHPSQFIIETLDGDNDVSATAARDVIAGDGGDDSIFGGDGDDELYGGYGDDSLEGGAGDDVLEGGRGSDALYGGDGDDLLVVRSDAGEQRIGQLAVGNPTRPDPDGEVNYDRQKLIGWESMPLVSDDILHGGAGEDVFMINPLINAKLDIIQKHVRSDGTINWAGVAGENDELHDHWVDSFGIVMIADYNAAEDQIAVIGHTATICDIEYRDINGDGIMETIVSITSDQGGGCAATGASTCACLDNNARAGGAHDQDLLGQIIVYGDLVTADDIVTDAGVTYGIVETYAEVAEALFPQGETKVTEIDGEIVYGYDTRDEEGNYGAIMGAPEDYFENPYVDDVTFGMPSDEELFTPTRDPFDQLGTVAVADQVKEGGMGSEVIAPDAPPASTGLPGALGFWSLGGGSEGAYANGRAGGDPAKAYTLYENQALLRTGDEVAGPYPGATALSFNGEDDYAFIPHDPAYQITQGTIALWVNPGDLGETSIFVSKDARNTGDGGHFRLGHTDDGGLLLRMAPGDGGGNKAWETAPGFLTEGTWSHIAVNFTAGGVTVFVDGVAVPNGAWSPKEGDVPTPGVYREAYILNNEEPWVLGADSFRAEVNGTAQKFALDDEDLQNEFEGALADFGVWGGFTPDDALSPAEIADLIANGPGAALTNPSGPQPMLEGDDEFSGGAGGDTILGEAGDDTLSGESGNDSILGGYGDDLVYGGSGADTMDGGRGSDLLFGGSGNDVLRSRSDVGEDRAGQLVLGEPSRPNEPGTIDETYLKLIDWVDQPLIGDDILVGGAGNDHFQFELLINGKIDAIMDNVMSDGRMVHWHGVAGENKYVHDHWVDGIGVDVVADFDADDDHISIIGHTVNIEIDYKALDNDGDGMVDEVVSIITAYSQQGNGGGAHDEDILGYVVVHGDLVTEDMVETDAGAHYGIVRTIDELQEAFAPTGAVKTSVGPNGEELFGYDSRDVEGDPIAADPETYAENPYADLVTYDANGGRGGEVAVLLDAEGGTFDGDDFAEIPHEAAFAQEEGTFALTFTADAVGARQTLLSKDHSNFEDGGHLTIWVDDKGRVAVRFQSETDSFHLSSAKNAITAGETHSVAFSFDDDQLSLFVDGALVDVEEGFDGGMEGNAESIVLGASTVSRRGDDLNLKDFFAGTIGGLLILDRSITPLEAILLDAEDNDPAVLDYDLATAGDGNATGDDDGMVMEGGAGAQNIAGSAGDDYMRGGDGDDSLIGASGHDLIAGDNNDDTLRGGDGDDSLYGGWQNDFIVGDGGDDWVRGGQNNDLIAGGAGDDTLYGDGGNDRIVGGDGDDTLLGGAGNDKLDGSAGDDRLEGGYGADSLLGGTGEDVIAGQNDNDTLRGGADDDALYGGWGSDMVVGDAGDDWIRGGQSNDILNGGAGDDTLFGDQGNDVLAGGSGGDQFAFQDGFGVDDIRDFDASDADEKIDLSRVSAIEDWRDLNDGGHLIDRGPNVEIRAGADRILIRNVTVDELTEDSFLF